MRCSKRRLPTAARCSGWGRRRAACCGSTAQNWTGFGVAAGLPSAQVWSLLETDDAEGRHLWIGTTAGPATLRLSDGRIEVPAGAPRDSVSSLLTTVSPAGQRTVWVGTYGGGLLRYSDGVWRRLGPAENLPSLFVTDLAASPSGGPDSFWIATDGGGVAQYSGGSIRTVQLGALLASRAVYKILETRAEQGAQAVWLGTRNNGLIRMTEGLWRAFQPFPETPNVPVTAILQRAERDGSTSLWLGTDGYGVAVWRARASGRGSTPLGRDRQQYRAGARRVAGDRRAPVGLGRLAQRRSLELRWRALAALRPGRRRAARPTWCRRCSSRRAARPRDALGRDAQRPRCFRRRTWRRTASGHRDSPRSRFFRSSTRATAAAVEELWVGTTNGLFRFAGGRWRHWNDRPVCATVSVQSLHESVAPRRASDAVDRHRRRRRRCSWRWTRPTRNRDRCPSCGSPALPNGSVYSILEDRERRIYISTNSGVSRLTRTATGFRKEEFTTDHGLPLNQGNRGAGLVDDRGRLWVGTIGGAAAFDPAGRVPRPAAETASPARQDRSAASECALFDRGALAHNQNGSISSMRC